ncbi:lasso peptide biosynthesis PqqD family chaperone [Paenibacillus bovis]|uniref:Metallophosphoesterase n=1 Tax=Paenibacillus bovis TaxID=1616788 RepID=A0A172ZED6_9BACL|nr:lasso peptide biosynthesis PqqD family chaperone [Paenibacillus bovis]ANF95853.1 metallophosphoesterase [Paenibacillus bovis]
MSKQMMNDTQKITQNSNYIASDMNGEKVMLDIESGKYYNLGAIGGRIWDISEKPVTVDEIVAVLVQEYDVAQDVCKQQVSVFVEKMLQEGLVEVNGAAVR